MTFDMLYQLDCSLLNLQHIRFQPDDFVGLFADQARASKYYVNGESYAALAKEIIEVVYPM